VPDALVIYGNSAQVMRLVTGALWKRGGALTSSFTGRIDCSDEIIRTAMTGEYQVILPCYGDRVFGHTEDWEMAFSLPGSKMAELVEGLEGTHKGGVRAIRSRAICASRLSIRATTTSWSASGLLTLPQSQGRRHCGDLGESIQRRSS
jgi:hypothetical protein